MTEVQDNKERKAVLILEVIPQPWQDMIRALAAERDNLRVALAVAEPALRYSSSVIQNLENVISDYRQDWVQADTAADIALAALEATK